MRGIVIKSTGSWYEVKVTDKQVFQCRIRGKFRMSGIKSTNPVAVGDWVHFELESGKETGVIEKIEERKNYIVRKSVNLSKRSHIIASNIDQAFLLVTIDNPTTHTGFIDRFLVTAEAYHIPAILLFNKADTWNNEVKQKQIRLQEIYENIGYDCRVISATTGDNIEEIKALMKDKVTMVSGHSGAGKSTLVNAVEPGLHIKTAQLSDQHNQGQHTTTFAEMHALHFGGYIIDTPGIRGFGVIDIEKEEYTNLFPEMFKLKASCKFNNCLHIDEPKCAVKLALETGEICESRYKNYVQMVNGEEDSPYRQLSY